VASALLPQDDAGERIEGDYQETVLAAVKHLYAGQAGDRLAEAGHAARSLASLARAISAISLSSALVTRAEVVLL